MCGALRVLSAASTAPEGPRKVKDNSNSNSETPIQDLCERLQPQAFDFAGHQCKKLG